MACGNCARHVSLILRVLFLLCLSQATFAQSVGDDIDIVNVNDWGSGFNATFSYTISADDVLDDLVRDWRIEIDYSGSGSIGNAYMSGYSGNISSGNIGPNDGFTITNEDVGYRPELDQGFALTFTIQGQGSGFSSSDFDIRFVNLTVLPTNNFTASLVSVNDWYNPSWGGGFNATFRCDVEGPDAQIGPVTDLLIEFNYTGDGTPSTAWTQSHNGPITHGFIASDGGYAISNEDGFQPELYAGDTITFAIQVQNAPFNEVDFDIQCSAGGATPSPNNKPLATNQSLTTPFGQALNIELMGSDADGDPLTYVIETPPLHGSLAGTPPELVYTPENTYEGDDSFSFIVSDNESSSTPSIISIVVLPRPNIPPVATNQSLTTPFGQDLNIELMGSDADGDPLTYVIETPPLHGSLAGTPPELVYTPENTYEGDDSFSFIVSDNESSSTPSIISIVVLPRPNIPPVADAGADIDAQLGQLVDLIGSGTDADNDPLTYTWSLESAPAESSIGDPPSNLQSFALSPDVAGTYVFSLTVNDGQVSSAADNVVVNVVAVQENSAPTAFAGPNEVGTVGEPVELFGSGFDLDGDILTYRWSILTQPFRSSVQFNSDGSIVTFNPDRVGLYRFGLTVNDGQVDSEIDVTEVMVGRLNSPPIVMLSAQINPNNVEYIEYLFDASETIDVDEGPDAAQRLTFNWEVLEPEANSVHGLVVSGNSVSSQGPTARYTNITPFGSSLINDVEAVVVRVTASDGIAESEPVELRVNPNYREPPNVIVETPRQGALSQEVEMVAVIESNGFFNDVAWSVLERPLGSNAQLLVSNEVVERNTVLDPVSTNRFVPDQPGTYTIQVVVDNRTSNDPDIELITLLVQDPSNSVPVANIASGPATEIVLSSESAVYTLDGTNSFDIDGDGLEYFWTVDEQPFGSAAGLRDNKSDVAELLVSVRGRYVVSLVVNDGQTVSAKTSISIDVVGSEPNRPPIAVPGEYGIFADKDYFELDAYQSSDPDGDPISYQWFLGDEDEDFVADPDLGDAVDPITGLPVDPITGLPFDPITGLPVDPITGVFVPSPGGSASGPLALTSPSPSSSVRFLPDGAGSYTFTLKVTDSQGASSMETVEIEVEPANRAPVAKSGFGNRERLILAVGSTIQLNGSASSDPDGDTLFYEWSVRKPEDSSATFIDPTLADQPFTFDTNGDYRFVLEVNDGDRNRAISFSVFAVSVPNQLPVTVLPTTFIADVGETIVIDASESFDPDGDRVLLASPLVLSFPIDSGRSAFSLFPKALDEIIATFNSPGVFEVAFRTTDRQLVSEAAVVRFIIGDISPQAVIRGETSAELGSALRLSGSNSFDSSGHKIFSSSSSMEFEWSIVSAPIGSQVILDNTDGVETEITFDAIGSYTIALDVVDLKNNAHDVTQITIDVTSDSEGNDSTDGGNNNPPVTASNEFSPVAFSGENSRVVVNTEIPLYGGLSSDDDVDTLSFLWNLTSQPGSSQIDIENSENVASNLKPDVAGTYVASLTVTDSFGNSDTHSHTIVAIDDSGLLPPDPGLSGRETLHGVDIDNDLIRDDVQRYIFANFGSDGPFVESLNNLAISYDDLLQSRFDETLAIDSLNLLFRRLDCVDLIGGALSGDVAQELLFEFFNTADRFYAMGEFEQQFTGKIMTINRNPTVAENCQ